MAKVFVPCNNKQEAIAAREANLLHIRYLWGEYELCEGIDVEWLTLTEYGEYYILTDDDE